MARLKGADQEQRCVELLTATAQFIISGGSLALYSGSERLILRMYYIGPMLVVEEV